MSVSCHIVLVLEGAPPKPGALVEDEGGRVWQLLWVRVEAPLNPVLPVQVKDDLGGVAQQELPAQVLRAKPKALAAAAEQQPLTLQQLTGALQDLAAARSRPSELESPGPKMLLKAETKAGPS